MSPKKLSHIKSVVGRIGGKVRARRLTRARRVAIARMGGLAKAKRARARGRRKKSH